MAMTFSSHLQNAIQSAAAKAVPLVIDEDAMMAPFKPKPLDTLYRLTWTEAALHDAPPGATATEYERKRDFKHLGGAIAWARRRIFHGHTFGDVIEMVEVHRSQLRDGTIDENVSDPIDITLPGFVRWKEPEAFDQRKGYIAGKAERKCTWDQ